MGYAVHAGDAWRVTPKLTLDYSVRWDYITPMAEKFNNLTFFDPVGLNPGTGTTPATQLPGRLAYASNKWGAASYGARYPEIPFKTATAPRVGFAYTLNDKTVLRAGYGLYFGPAFYPGWGGGMSQDGLNKTVNLSESPSGTFEVPALYLETGISAAQTGSTASIVNSAFDNGGGSISYRPLDGNRRPYSSQWSMTVEHQLPSNFFVSLSYVGTKGTHLPSSLGPLNVINPNSPQVQAIGAHLSDTFAVGQTTALDGVLPPYPGWAAQMTGCAPTVAQALLPYPMYCGNLQGLNEQRATSIYNSFQGKVERHLTHGLYLLATTTVSKIYSDASVGTQAGADNGAGNQGNDGQFSPFLTKPRAWTITPDNVPVTAQVSAVYDLPFGVGKQFLNTAGPSNAVLGGWQVTPLFHYDYGTPISFYASNCATSTIAPQLREGCVPGILPGQLAQLHGRNGYNPYSGSPYLNPYAFEPSSAFTQFGYTGTGKAVTGVYGPSYQNLDVSLSKNTQIFERVNFKFSANFFNSLNNHSLIATQASEYGGPSAAFNTDVSKPTSFGMWNGSVSSPRTIQFAGRLEF